MTLEQGKLLKESKGKVLTGVENFRFAAEEARRLYGEIISAPKTHGRKYRFSLEDMHHLSN
ncbi:succinate-semialdehyde dehydrogenase [Listeria seeligeri FSL S4-171]|nr:succinate-semialdehyde dehydrogenase [Listeria seeligeri FSL S4-171]